jgi:sulfite exporter TauE/SafE
MPVELTLVSAFLIGFLGSTHCIGMCGGIVGTLTVGVNRESMRSSWSVVPFLVAYNIGRITTYACLGAVLGFIGAQVLNAVPSYNARLVARLTSGGFMVALGLYLTGWWLGLGALERLGGRLWMRIEPFGRRLLPVRHAGKAFLVGLVWGWLPCGLVYATAAWSLSAGSAGRGAALMAAFGLGTLPMLFALGATARWLGAATRVPAVRRAAGIVVLLFGAYTLWLAASPAGHEHVHVVRGQQTPAIKDQAAVAPFLSAADGKVAQRALTASSLPLPFPLVARL